MKLKYQLFFINQDGKLVEYCTEFFDTKEDAISMLSEIKKALKTLGTQRILLLEVCVED